MVNASLNWASLIGITCFVYGVVAAGLTVPQLIFKLQRRADLTPQLVISTLATVVQGLGRAVGLPLTGGILFFQGWRLDPILQFAIFLLGAGVIAESAGGLLNDLLSWQQRRTDHSTPGSSADSTR